MKDWTKQGLPVAIIIGMMLVSVGMAASHILRDQVVFGVPGFVIALVPLGLAFGLLGGALIKTYTTR